MSIRTGVLAAYRDQAITEYRDNPLIAALPEICSERDAAVAMLVRPHFDPSERDLPTEHRWHLLGRLKHVVVPRPKYYEIERTISRLIRAGYVLRNPMRVETWRRIYGAQSNLSKRSTSTDPSPQLMSADSKATLVGLSGIGKTTAIDAVLRVYPDQVIRHEAYDGHHLPITQIVWLKVTCPENGSISSFCREFARQLDRALGVDKYERMYSRSKLTRDELEGMMRQHSATYFLGLLVIDEIQRLSLAKTQGAAPLLDFFQDLRDHLKVPSLLIGTYKAVRLFQRELKDARRASESGLIDIERPTSASDGEWVKFVRRLWTYQWTRKPTTLDDELLRTLYDLTQGITDILVILFKLAQQRAMLDLSEEVNVECIRSTYEEMLPLLHPAVNALRSRSPEKLARFEDLLPPNRDLLIKSARHSFVDEADDRLDAMFSAGTDHTPVPIAATAMPRKKRLRKSDMQSDDLRTATDAPDSYGALRAIGAVGDDSLFGDTRKA
ncbi:ATP-binding protein [Paraburkholderia sp. MMS20-SJTN17]|uniref:ATP-binding protein n=1 Tax=Paraburkholderia translucens TaxID=2886945 RepID=A0ABS8KBA9_9BURK|nr:ATP-binding protein [Paraburkholderia sp. MMS20-SJTN17]MCC8402056.1 ATP-binding protein [Paraburkholderia sp. MMS20-SJTN17]